LFLNEVFMEVEMAGMLMKRNGFHAFEPDRR
jgi:hypothetical protein